MTESHLSQVVITGAPGAGKTTLLQALHARGFTIVSDSPRVIIQQRKQRGLSPRPERAEFVQQTLRMDIDNYRHHAASAGPVFYERGVIDALAGLHSLAPLAGAELRAWLQQYQYCPKVFLLPPWRDIYVTDAERDQTFEHALFVDQVTRQWYQQCGYDVIEVPMTTMEQRCVFVLGVLADLAERHR